MLKENLIPADEFCISHDIEISFISSLYENGLIDITTIDETVFIYPNQLPQLEKISRLHYELGINMEGIDTINHLLNRIDEMQREINVLRNRLRLYE
jgi:hypothetical protein